LRDRPNESAKSADRISDWSVLRILPNVRYWRTAAIGLAGAEWLLLTQSGHLGRRFAEAFGRNDVQDEVFPDTAPLPTALKLRRFGAK
jgi:hypothetical protein